ncbi:hypothetical protein BGZ70_005490, partial [Mortierella alpina]
MESRKRTNVDTHPQQSKARVVSECSISDNAAAIHHNATATFERLLKFQKAPEEQKVGLLRRYLEGKYKCVPGLADLLQELLVMLEQPVRHQVTALVRDKIKYAIAINGVVHQCGRENLGSPGAAHIEGDARSVYEDTKRTLLKRLFVTELMHNIEDCRQTSPSAGGIAKLRAVLELMRVGRFNRAIDDIMEHWTYDDCIRILKDGMEVYSEQRNSEQQGDTGIQMHLAALVHDLVHERFFEQLDVDRSEAEKVICA